MSGHLHDTHAINRKLAAKVDDLVPRLFGHARIVGHYWRMGDASGSPGGSLAIWRTGAKAGEWCDFGNVGRAGKPEGGKLLELVIRWHGGNVSAGIKWAAAYVGETGKPETSAERTAREKRDAKLRADFERRREADIARKRRQAKGLFLSAAPIAGTPAERYLRGRGIDLGILGRTPGALRYHPAIKFPDDGIERPCLLAAVVDDEGFLTVHRHWLQCHADGRVTKAPVTDPKRSYSSFTGGIIPLWRGQTATGAPGVGWRDMSAPEQIVVTEGIEDALSVAIAMPDMRIAACVTLGNLGTAWLPDVVDAVYWHRHRDTSREALSSYVQQRAQLTARGIEVREVFAPDGHKDFNDWLQAQRVADVSSDATKDVSAQPERMTA